jgi:hypothetical protein
MRVTDYIRTQGAILEKVMSSLESEKGLVLVNLYQEVAMKRKVVYIILSLAMVVVGIMPFSLWAQPNECDLWVDFLYCGVEYGTFENPYSTLGKAVTAATGGETVCIKPGSSSEILTIIKPLTLQAIGGTAIIGESRHCTPPFYNPEKWNDGDYIQKHNNCYNYANDERTDSYAQPGYWCGDYPQPCTCPEVYDAAKCDGLVPSDATCPCPGNMHKVYLVIEPPGSDYHWYRQDTSGWWSHKVAWTEARNWDDSGAKISNPETADTGSYTVHCGYMCACGDNATIDGPL